MTHPTPAPFPSLSRRRPLWQRLGLLVAGASTVALQLGAIPAAWAGDPFRSQNPSPSIGDSTEEAFYQMFRDGDYVSAHQTLRNAPGEQQDPLFHAMLASMAYLEQDWDTLLSRAQTTQRTATALIDGDEPLRGHLYSAVGLFLEGAHHLRTVGVARGTPRALAMLQQVFSHLDQAEAIDANDPELSLLKGFMDLLLAVNLPFANPETAIARLANHGAPTYVAQRGIAIGHRDLGQYTQALRAVDRALQAVDAAVPGEDNTNPELLYLKAQILMGLQRYEEGRQYFAQALEYRDQLPQELATRIEWEQCIAQGTPAGTCSQRAGY